MNAKPYSIGLSLFAALLLNGCGQKTIATSDYDIPTLLFSDFKTAEKMLGKADPDGLMPMNSRGGIHASNWNLENDFNITIFYREATNMPRAIALAQNEHAPALEHLAFLKMFNLRTNDPQYIVLLVGPEKGGITQATVEPRHVR